MIVKVVFKHMALSTCFLVLVLRLFSAGNARQKRGTVIHYSRVVRLLILNRCHQRPQCAAGLVRGI